MLSISGFEKKYPSGFEVVIPQLDLPKGIHLLMGGNGSGKSTLLKALAGIHPAKGTIQLEGISLEKQPIEYRKKIGYAEAEPNFPEFLSISDLIEVVAKAKAATLEEIEDLTYRFGTNSFANNPIGGYSSGMLKKTALVLAFLGNPKWVILDEPFTTIDVETQEQLIRLIQEKASASTGFLITSHQPETLEIIQPTSILRMKNGKIEQHG